MHMTRRNFLQVATSIALPVGTLYSSSAHAETIAGERTLEEWMDEAMKSSKRADTTLYLSRFPERIYFLTKPITWKPNPGQEAFLPVEVPVGFVTDFASIPRVFWSILPPDGLYTYPAIVHDYLYWTQTRPRDVADEILKFGMGDFNVGTVTIQTIYQAVRLGGSSAWNENARLKAQGEKRVLKLFPDKPTITWEEWKKRSDVF
jgi:hypothetical protein